MVGSWTLSMASFIDKAGPDGEGALMPQTFIQVPTNPKRKAFIATTEAVNRRTTASPRRSRPRRATTRSTCWPPPSSRPAPPNGRKIKEALENLKTKVEGVVTTYNKPFTATDHEAITANIPVFGKVKGERVVADDSRRQAGVAVRVKDTSAKPAPAAAAKK